MKRRDVEAPPIMLTAEQESLFESVADVCEEAVSAALRGHALLLRHLTLDDMRSLAVIGGKEATASHEPEEGPLRPWVFFGALHKVLDSARDENKQHAKVIALLRAAAMLHWKRFTESVEIGVDGEAELTEKLHGASNGFYARAALQMAAAEPTEAPDPEQDLGLRRAAGWSGEALRRVVGSATAQEQTILVQHFREKKPLTKIAAELGLKKSQYRTFVRSFDKLLATLGTRLGALGVKGMPVWQPDVSGTALGSEG